MRQLEEMWNAWGETRTSVILRSIQLAYLLWKNNWIVNAPAPLPPNPRPAWQPLKVKEE
jgi:hypothetical protein